MTTSRLRSAIITLYLAVSVQSSTLSQRAAQTSVVCPADFNWAQNKAGLSPCLLAALASDACTGTGWEVDPLSADQHYSVNKEAANACTCSWAAYNLLQACTACQGFEGSVQNWATISTGTNCTGYISTTEYFPENVKFQGDASVPYWATLDPSTWSFGRFDPDQAKELASEGRADVTPGQSQTASESSTPIGPIVGGVVGGVVVLALGVLTAIFIVNRRRKAAGAPGVFSKFHDQGHPHNAPDLTQNTSSGFISRFYPHHSRTPSEAPLMPGTAATFRTTPTIHTHTGSLASISQFGAFRSTYTASPAPAEVVSPIIEPFMMPHPTSHQPSPSSPQAATVTSQSYFPQTPTPGPRSAGGSSYEPSIAPSSRAEDTGYPATPRRRVNPPAYSPYAGGEQQNSADATPASTPPVLRVGRPEKSGLHEPTPAPPLSPVPEPVSPAPSYGTAPASGSVQHVSPATPAPTQRTTSPPPTHRPTTPSSEDGPSIA